MKLTDHTAHYQRDAEQFDYFAPRSGADLDAERRIQQAVLAMLPDVAAMRVLDLGSGNGWTLAHPRLRASALLVCVDLGVANLRTLRRRFPAAQLVAADAARLPFRPASFDRVVASEILEHVNDPEDVLRQIHHVLVAGGRLIASTPYRETLRYSLCIHCNQPTPVNAHVHSFDEHALLSLLAAAGFHRPEFFTFLNKALVFLRISQLLRALPWRLWRLIDRMSNFVLKKPQGIVVTGETSVTPNPHIS